MSKNQKIYAIVDLETTGGMARRDKITEIGIVLFDGNNIIDKFQSLVNPERSIPPEITRITGITNEMVADAPKFYEVAKEVVERTEGAIFVAHNVRFDYSFLREEFTRLGYTYTRRQLCTVRLARNNFPGLRSYSLGNLIQHFDIEVNARHRALDDALATTELLKYVLQKDHGEFTIRQIINAGIRESKLPKGITLDFLHNLPETPGVYYFYNSYQKVVYVGKSKSLKSRVMQHFAKTTLKAEKLAKMVASISVEETGSELIALLLESREIKTLQPEVNKAQRTKNYPYFIHTYKDENGYINYQWLKSSIKARKNKNVLNHYGSKQGAISHLIGMAKELNLCLDKLGLKDRPGPCYKYSMEECFGACVGEEEAESYNERALLGNELLKRVFDKNFIIQVEGRSKDEIGVVLIEDGNYKGFGYISIEDFQYGIEEIKEAINYEPENPEVNRIIYTYLNKNPSLRITYF
jgi:DNA polymerase-3 subunit epsilon